MLRLTAYTGNPPRACFLRPFSKMADALARGTRELAQTVELFFEPSDRGAARIRECAFDPAQERLTLELRIPPDALLSDTAAESFLTGAVGEAVQLAQHRFGPAFPAAGVLGLIEAVEQEFRGDQEQRARGEDQPRALDAAPLPAPVPDLRPAIAAPAKYRRPLRRTRAKRRSGPGAPRLQT